MTFDDGYAGAHTEPLADIIDSATGSPRRPRARVLTAAAIMGTAAVVAASLLGSRYLSRSLSPAAFVTQSAQRTLAEHTADITLSGTITAANQHIPVAGTGEVSFVTGALEFNLSASAAGESLTERELEVHGAYYVAYTVNGTSMPQNDGGRPWIQVPLQQSGRARADGSDPSSALSVLERNGNKVRPLGTKVIGGVTCTGFAVTTGKSALIAGAKSEQAAARVSASVASSQLRAIGNMKPPVYTIWLSPQMLLRRMSLRLQETNQASGIGADLVMDFSNYGAPVHISAPPPAKVISYASLAR